MLKIKLRFAVGLTLFATLPVLTGCAFGTREVYLKNSVTTNVSENNERNHEVCFDDLSDSRNEGNIGHVQNGYGMHTAEVVAQNNVQDWINTEIKSQIRMAGYSVHENCSPQRAGLIEIQGKIVKVYTTAYLSYLGEVTIDASVSLDSSIIINKKYSGHTQGGLNMAASSYMFGETLQKALKSMITQLIADINSIDQGTIEGVREKSPVIQVPNLVESDSDKKTYSGVAANGVVKADGCPAEKNGVSIVSGTRSRTSVSSVLDSIKIPLRSLYYDRFELNSSLSGSICIQFSISPDGKVYDMQIVQNSLEDKPIEDKLLQLLSKRKFRSMKDKKPTVVNFKINFDPKSARSSKGVMAAFLAILATIPLLISIFNLTRL